MTTFLIEMLHSTDVRPRRTKSGHDTRQKSPMVTISSGVASYHQAKFTGVIAVQVLPHVSSAEGIEHVNGFKQPIPIAEQGDVRSTTILSQSPLSPDQLKFAPLQGLQNS